MVFEDVRPAYVPDDRARVAVPRLIHDPSEIRASLGRCRDVASP